jgi:hypothetical protein
VLFDNGIVHNTPDRESRCAAVFCRKPFFPVIPSGVHAGFIPSEYGPILSPDAVDFRNVIFRRRAEENSISPWGGDGWDEGGFHVSL